LPPQPHSHLPSAHRALPPVLASPQDSSVNSFSNASSSSYARGGSEETKEEMPFDHRSGHHNMNLAMVNKHNKSSSSSSRAHSSSSFSASAAAGMLHTGPMPSSQFYPQGAAPPPRPILNQGDECFVRDGNDSWRPGVVRITAWVCVCSVRRNVLCVHVYYRKWALSVFVFPSTFL